MNKVEERLLELIRAAEAEGKGKPLAELVIGYKARIQMVLKQGLVEENQEGGGNEGVGVPKKLSEMCQGDEGVLSLQGRGEESVGGNRAETVSVPMWMWVSRLWV